MDDSAFRFFGAGIVYKPCPCCGCRTAVGFDRNDPGVHDREATECTWCMAAKISNEVQFSRADPIPLTERGECVGCRGPARVYGPKGRQFCAACESAASRKEPKAPLQPCRRLIPGARGTGAEIKPGKRAESFLRFRMDRVNTGPRSPNAKKARHR
jgi:hypothetical protein